MLAARNIVSPGGSLETNGRNLIVLPSGEFKSEKDIGDVIISKSATGTPLYLRDLVTISRGYQDPARYLNTYTVRDAAAGWQTHRAITIAVQMRSGEQIHAFGENVDHQLALLRQQLPTDLIMARTSDQPRQVEENVELLNHALEEAIVLVVITALIGFWEWRSALLMAVSIPLTLLMTFGFMDLVGWDIQQVSIASLIIALGLLIDDPVVAGDAIKRDLDSGHPGNHLRVAGTYQARARDPICDYHQHRRVPALRPAERRYRQVHDFAAGRDDGVVDRVAAGVDDVHPDARLLLAAARRRKSRFRSRSCASKALPATTTARVIGALSIDG